MRFELSEDQQFIGRTAREFLAARYKPEEMRRLALEEERAFTDQQWSEIVGLGWPELAIPEEQGGQGLGTVELAVVAEELGRALAPSPLQSTWAAALMLAAGGAADRLGEGRRGAYVADGLAADAAWADVIVFEDGRVATPDAVDIEKVESVDPTRRLFRVRGDGGERLSGDLDRARDQIAVMVAAESVGLAQRAMEMAVEYAKERKQFDRPIGTFQAVSHACAQMLLEVEGARAAVHWAAWALDHDPDSASVAASTAKAYASDAGVRVVRSALQVHGGIAFTWEHDMHFFLKRATANAALAGTAREHRRRVAGVILAAPR